MFKMIATIGVMYAVVFGIIEIFRSMTKNERMSLAKSAGYAAVISAITAIVLAGFVYLF